MRSGLKPCDENPKVPGSNPTRCSTGLGIRPRYEAPSDLQIEYVERDYHRVSKVFPSIMAQSWPRGSQLAVKKKRSNPSFYLNKTSLITIFRWLSNLAKQTFPWQTVPQMTFLWTDISPMNSSLNQKFHFRYKKW